MWSGCGGRVVCVSVDGEWVEGCVCNCVWVEGCVEWMWRKGCVEWVWVEGCVCKCGWRVGGGLCVSVEWV